MAGTRPARADRRERLGYPIHSLKDVPPGDYTVQAVLNKYETFHRADGKTVKMHMDQGEGPALEHLAGQPLLQAAEDYGEAGRRAHPGSA
jgi:hypothetical protein